MIPSLTGIAFNDRIAQSRLVCNVGSIQYKHLQAMVIPVGAFGFVVLARRLEDGSLCAVKFMQRGSRITKYVSREFINHRQALTAHNLSHSQTISCDASFAGGVRLLVGDGNPSLL